MGAGVLAIGAGVLVVGAGVLAMGVGAGLGSDVVAVGAGAEDTRAGGKDVGSADVGVTVAPTVGEDMSGGVSRTCVGF